MGPAELGTATVSVRDITAMTDAELAQYMQRHRLPDGNYNLPVDGWDKLSKDERSHLARRLEAQKRSLAQSPTACSRPLDLADLDARLRQVSPNGSFTPRLEPEIVDRRMPPTPPYDPTIRETEAYHKLLNDGGCPLYPIGLIQEVHRDPDNYAEMLRPWQEFLISVCPTYIFQRQWQRWQDFRKWQNDHRDRDDDDGGFPAYVEWQKHVIQRNLLPRLRNKLLARIEADPSCLESEWDQRQLLRRRQRRLCREHGCRGFSDYTEAVKRRLARHGFTQPLELDEDPKNQDKLTTWIEYLNYEYWWIGKYASDIERLEPEHEKLWQELVDENVLKPHETKDFVRTDTSGMECETEKAETEKSLQRAESEAKRIYVLTQEDPKRLDIPQAKRILMMKNAREKLIAARRRSEQAQRRSKLITQFVRATFGYDGAKREVVRQRVLVQWVLEQVPLIESEVNLSKNHRPGSDGRKRTKKRRTTDEELLEEQGPKRVKFEAEPEHSGTSSLLQNDAQAMLKGPRRSARLAARRDASRIAPEPDISQIRSLSRSKATSAQPQMPHPLIKSTKAAMARRQSPSSSQVDIAKPTRRSQRCLKRRRG